MIQIYSVDNNDYNANGNSVLTPLKCELDTSNWELELTHLVDDESRWKHIVEGAVLKVPSFNGEQLFRIEYVIKNDTVIEAVARPIFFDSQNDCILIDVRPTDKNGQEALDIMTAGTKYSGKSNIVDISTAYYVTKNLMDAMVGSDNSFVKRWGGEFIYDNYTIIVNERLGSDRGVELLYGKNIPIDGLSEEVDMSEVITRIIPKAYNGYMLPNNGWVDSPLLDNYPIIRIKVVEFSNVKLYEDASGDEGEIICDSIAELHDELIRQSNLMFSSGVDKPKVTIEADMILLADTSEYDNYKVLEDVTKGDTIHVKHSKLGIVTEARIINLVYDCIKNGVKSVTIGDMPFNYIEKTTSVIESASNVINSDNTLKADKMKGIIDALTTQFKYQKNNAQKQEVRAILFEDIDELSETYGALCIGSMGFQIANSRTADGKDWDWRTFGTADGFTADLINTGKINTELIEGWDKLLLKVSDIEEEIKNIDTTLYHAEIINDGTTITRDIQTVTLTATLMNASSEVTTSATSFNWKRVSSDTTADTNWNNAHKGRKSVVITSDDLDKNANFYCNVTAPEWSGKTSSVTINDETKIPQLSSSFLDVTGVQLVQTLNTDGTYSPSWTQMKPVITPSVVDGVLDVPLTECTIEYKRVVNGAESPLISGETVANGILTISKNVMSKTLSSITYIAYITYKGVSIKLFASFSLNVIGANGTDGVDGADGTDGADGLNGKDGAQGIPGKNGIDGKTSYTHIAYSNSADGKIDFSVSDSNRDYVGMYTDFVTTDSTDYTKYAWSKIKGADGTQGIPGTKGADGKTPYLHIAYANNSTGTSGFSTTDSVNKLYIGQYTDFVSADSTDPSKYAWTKTKGETGTQGIGIKSVIDEYYVSTSKIDPVGGSWSSAKPIWSTGKYLWKRTKNTKTDNTVTYTTAYCDNSWEAVNEIEIGDRNLVLKSNKKIEKGTDYNIVQGTLSEDWIVGETYTIMVKGKMVNSNTSVTGLGLWRDSGSAGVISSIPYFSDKGLYVATFKCPSPHPTQLTTLNKFSLYNYPSTTAVSSKIEWIKIVRGNKPSFDWTPAPEDQKQDLIDTEVRITESYNSAIEETNKNIRLFVAESIEATGDWQSALTSLRNEVVLTKDATEFLKTSSQVIKDLQSGKVDINEIKEWARFDGATLELGASNSQYKTKLTTTELGFYQGNTKVAWISNNELHVTSISAEKSIKTGTFIFEDEGAYGFTFKKAGG